MARKLRIRVDHNVCGECYVRDLAPHVFQLNANRQSEAVNPAGDTEEKILEAAENCPVSAIFVEDAETGNACSRRQSRGLAVLAPTRSGNPTQPSITCVRADGTSGRRRSRVQCWSYSRLDRPGVYLKSGETEKSQRHIFRGQTYGDCCSKRRPVYP